MTTLVKFSSEELGTLHKLVVDALKKLDETSEEQFQSRVKGITEALYNLHLATSHCSVSISMKVSCYAAIIKLSRGDKLLYKECDAIIALLDP